MGESEPLWPEEEGDEALELIRVAEGDLEHAAGALRCDMGGEPEPVLQVALQRLEVRVLGRRLSLPRLALRLALAGSECFGLADVQALGDDGKGRTGRIGMA